MSLAKPCFGSWSFQSVAKQELRMRHSQAGAGNAQKIMIEDMKVLVDLVEEGTVRAPRFLPPQFRDLSGLSSWLSFSRFMSSLNFRQMDQDYANIL